LLYISPFVSKEEKEIAETLGAVAKKETKHETTFAKLLKYSFEKNGERNEQKKNDQLNSLF